MIKSDVGISPLFSLSASFVCFKINLRRKKNQGKFFCICRTKFQVACVNSCAIYCQITLKKSNLLFHSFDSVLLFFADCLPAVVIIYITTYIYISLSLLMQEKRLCMKTLLWLKIQLRLSH